MVRMSLDDSLRRQLDLLIDELAEGNVNGLARQSGIREGSIRAILDGTTQSTRLITVEKLAEGLGVTPGALLNTERAPLNYALLQKILERLLRNLQIDARTASAIARSVLQAYEDGIETGVNPDDPQDVDKITRSEARQLRDAMRQPKAAK